MIVLAGNIWFIRCTVLVALNHRRCKIVELWAARSANICESCLEELWPWAKYWCWPLRVRLNLEASYDLWVVWGERGCLVWADRALLQVSSWCLTRIKMPDERRAVRSHRLLTLRGVGPTQHGSYGRTWRNFRNTTTAWGSNLRLLDNSLYKVLINTAGQWSWIIDKIWTPSNYYR